MKEQEIHLPNGYVVRCRPVPPYAYVRVGAAYREPPPPTVEVKSAAGHTERVLAAEGSPEWQAWREEVERIEQERMNAQRAFAFDYGVVAWRREDEEEWQTEPPDDWEFPDWLKEYGIIPAPRKRADYIRMEVLADPESAAKVMTVIYGGVAALSEEEVGAAEDLFRPQEE